MNHFVAATGRSVEYDLSFRMSLAVDSPRSVLIHDSDHVIDGIYHFQDFCSMIFIFILFTVSCMFGAHSGINLVTLSFFSISHVSTTSQGYEKKISTCIDQLRTLKIIWKEFPAEVFASTISE